MSLSLTKVAAVLEAAADHLEAIEAEKASSVNAERLSTVEELAGKYAEATGEEMPATIRQKLADSDKDVVALLKSVVEKQAGIIDSLGSGSSRNDGSEPKTVKEAAAAAEDRFLSWITS